MTLPLTAIACSSSAAPVDTTANVSITEPTPTPSTSASPTTTASTQPTTASTTVEDAIRAAHTRVMTELFARDERITGPEAILPLAEELTTGPLLKRIQDDARTRKVSGQLIVGPGYDSHIVNVTVVNETEARVLDCSQDRSEGYLPDGTLNFPADDFYKLRESEMVLVGDHWLAQEINTGGDNRCDPDT